MRLLLGLVRQLMLSSEASRAGFVLFGEQCTETILVTPTMVGEVQVFDRTKRQWQTRRFAEGALVVFENLRAGEALKDRMIGVRVHGLSSNLGRPQGRLGVIECFPDGFDEDVEVSERLLDRPPRRERPEPKAIARHEDGLLEPPFEPMLNRERKTRITGQRNDHKIAPIRVAFRMRCEFREFEQLTPPERENAPNLIAQPGTERFREVPRANGGLEVAIHDEKLRDWLGRSCGLECCAGFIHGSG